jgi:hypothetical protein
MPVGPEEVGQGVDQLVLVGRAEREVGAQLGATVPAEVLDA